MERDIKPTYDELESYVENLQKQLADAQATVEALQRERDALKLGLNALRDSYDELESRHNDTLAALDAEREKVQTLRDERDRLKRALQAFCDEVEMDAAVMAYKCDLGAGEWEAFIDRTKLYKQYQAAKAALTPAGGGTR